MGSQGFHGINRAMATTYFSYQIFFNIQYMDTVCVITNQQGKVQLLIGNCMFSFMIKNYVTDSAKFRINIKINDSRSSNYPDKFFQVICNGAFRRMPGTVDCADRAIVIFPSEDKWPPLVWNVHMNSNVRLVHYKGYVTRQMYKCSIALRFIFKSWTIIARPTRTYTISEYRALLYANIGFNKYLSTSKLPEKYRLL